MFSIVLPFCEKSFLRVEFTELEWLEKSYRRTVKHSIAVKKVLDMNGGNLDSSLKTAVTSGYLFQTSQQVFFPPANKC